MNTNIPLQLNLFPKVKVEYDTNTGDYYIPIPEEFYPTLTELGWNPGDDIEWTENGNGSYTLKKVEGNE